MDKKLKATEDFIVWINEMVIYDSGVRVRYMDIAVKKYGSTHVDKNPEVAPNVGMDFIKLYGSFMRLPLTKNSESYFQEFFNDKGITWDSRLECWVDTLIDEQYLYIKDLVGHGLTISDKTLTLELGFPKSMVQKTVNS